ncbi:MAG: hypothetical protein KC486_00955 [Myxococcales bacterium]|nr:hypothetical protein [Myxococcales bacterium]
MQSNLASITTPLPLSPASPLAFALALAIVAPGCVLDITDFKESATTATTAVVEDTTSDGGTSDSGTSDSSTSVASTTTTGDEDSATTLDPNSTDTPDTDDGAPTGGPGESPACDAYTDDIDASDPDACIAELGCAAHTSEETCDGSYYNIHSFKGVGCTWGNLLTGLYIEEEQLCDGDIKGVCRAALFNPNGGPPCDGYFHDFGDSLEVLNLDCHIPLADDWQPCTVDGDTDFPACDHCFPELP